MTSDLRARVEAVFATNTAATPLVSTAGMKQLLHELWVRLDELERQNAALQQAAAEWGQAKSQEQLRALLARLEPAQEEGRPQPSREVHDERGQLPRA